MELKGSKTGKNLLTAFAGESQARNKYDYFASRAKKDGCEQIAAIFQETALDEKEHAKMRFKELGGIGDTPANLLAAAAGGHEDSPRLPKSKSTTKSAAASSRSTSKRAKRGCGSAGTAGNAATAARAHDAPRAVFPRYLLVA